MKQQTLTMTVTELENRLSELKEEGIATANVITAGEERIKKLEEELASTKETLESFRVLKQRTGEEYLEIKTRLKAMKTVKKETKLDLESIISRIDNLQKARESGIRIRTELKPKKPQQSKTSPYIGVYKQKGKEGFAAQISIKGKVTYLGRYILEEEAAAAYDIAVLRMKGKDAQTNFPKENYQGLV